MRRFYVTFQASTVVEVDAENEVEARKIGRSLLDPDTDWDFEDIEEEREDLCG